MLGGERAGYGQQILPALARQLRAEYGRGWSEQQLRHCIRAAEVFSDESILSALRRELSWTHLKMLVAQEIRLKDRNGSFGAVRIALEPQFAVACQP